MKLDKPEIATLSTRRRSLLSAMTRLLPPLGANNGNCRERANSTASITSASLVGFDEVARRATDAERGEGSQSNLFANEHGCKANIYAQASCGDISPSGSGGR